MLGGGQVAGLLRFQNNDLAEGRNLLGRMAIAISESMNTQNRLGLTSMAPPVKTFLHRSAWPTPSPAAPTSGATMGAAGGRPRTKLQASSFEIAFTGTTAGSVTRHSDNKVFVFANLGDLTTIMANNGLAITDGGAARRQGAAAGDRFLANPMVGAAAEFKALQYLVGGPRGCQPGQRRHGRSEWGYAQLASLGRRPARSRNRPRAVLSRLPSRRIACNLFGYGSRPTHRNHCNRQLCFRRNHRHQWLGNHAAGRTQKRRHRHGRC